MSAQNVAGTPQNGSDDATSANLGAQSPNFMKAHKKNQEKSPRSLPLPQHNQSQKFQLKPPQNTPLAYLN